MAAKGEISINFKPSKKQYEAWQILTDNKEVTFLGYGGAAMGGKSYLACYWITTMCIGFPGVGYGLGRKSLTNLKRTTLITLFDVFKECGITDKYYTYNQQLNTITFWNGSQIFLIDTAYQPSDPLFERFGGYELTGLAIDESGETPKAAIDILLTRIGRRKNHEYNIPRKLLETFNPSKSHVYVRYYKPYSEGTLPPHYAFIPALPKDNPSPEVDSYIEGILQSGDKVTIQRLIHGNFEYDDDDNAMIEYDAIINLFQTVPKPGEDKYVKGIHYLTVDVARLGKDNAILMVWNDLSIIHIEVVAKCTLVQLQDSMYKLMKKYRILPRYVIIDEDGVGGGLKDFTPGIKGFTNNARPIKKQNYQNLKTQCYYKLATYINEGKIKIVPSQYDSAISQELEQVKRYRADADAKMRIVPKELIKKNIGRSPDFSDAIMMRMFYEFRKARATYSIW